MNARYRWLWSLWLCLGGWVFLTGNFFASAQEVIPQVGAWQPLFAGVDYQELKASEPRLMQGYAVRIALPTPELRFLATPGEDEPETHTLGLKTSTFLKRTGCQVAINAAPFGPIHKEEGLPQKISGLTISAGKIVSPAEGSYPALLISKDNCAELAEPPFQLKDVYNAVSGFGIVLRGGKLAGTTTDVHPRTAVGLSQNGKTMYWLVIDGRQPKYSVGATTREVGAWLAALGAWDGLNLDGGGTTTLVIQDETTEGGVRVLNRPIHAGVPGTERVSASHLGLFAPPLPRK